MAVIKFSQNVVIRFIAGIGTAFLVVAGFLAMVVGMGQKMPHPDKSTLTQDMMLPKTALADTPVSSSCGSGVSGGGDGSAGSSCACGSGDGSCDGQESADSPGCDGDGGKVICTELFKQGLLDPVWYRADEKFAAIVPANVRIGYLMWAQPTVLLMRKSHMFTKTVSFLAIPWAKQMAYEMGATDEGSKFGKILMYIGMPVCGVLGTVATSFKRSQYTLGA